MSAERAGPYGASEQAGRRQPRTRAFAASERLQRLIEPVDVRVGGGRPWDPVIRDRRAIGAILRHGSLGAGEAFVRGWWDVDALDVLIYRLLDAGIQRRLPRWHRALSTLQTFFTNLQSRRHAYDIAEAHYDRGNALFEAMLDPLLTYSCGYWKEAEDLAAAQGAKLDLICRKLDLQAGQRVLDVGCGWGSFCRYAAERYGVSVLGITVSGEQLELARERCSGLPVELRLADYRELDGVLAGDPVDHVVSVGMFEHVGARNYRTLFETVRRCLKPGGLFLLHTIGGNSSARVADPWIDRYIFPHGHIPSLAQIGSAAEGIFVTEDLHNFGADYDRTLMAWWRNFDAAWPSLAERYGETFYRLWKYYLLSCAGAFRARDLQLWQLVLSPEGVRGGYRRPE